MAVRGQLPAHLQPDPAVAAGDERDHAAASRITRASAALARAAGAIGKTACGWPAAAHTVSKRCRSSSKTVVMCARMADGRDAADRVAGDLAHVGGVGALDRLADRVLDARLVGAVVAGDEREHRLVRVRAAHHERLHDRAELAADGRGGLGRGARGVIELVDLGGQAELEQRCSNPPGAAGNSVLAHPVGP